MTRTPTPRDSENSSPSTSPRSALASVRRDSSAYASTASPDSAASTATRQRSARSGTGSTDRDPGDPKRRRAAADRSLLPVFPADPLPGVEVVGDGVDRGHHLDRAADQIGAPHGRRDLAPFDQERLRAPENEVAARRVDLAAAERRDEHALVRALDDRLGAFGAVEDVRVGHPRDRRR